MSGILQLINTFGPSGPFAVKNSLRLRSSANAYLSRVITLSATWTLSIWVKRGALGVTSPIFGASVLFNSNDTLTAGTLTTTAVYRDPSAWYHIVVSNSGCYVNGVSVGSTTTGVLVSPLIGSNAVNYFDGYLAELNLIDGQALTPSSFGAFDATSGVWQPTRYSGTYGTNGFYLKFSDTTSTTTLCYDYSGNSNNWTPNNISLTAGSTYDSMLDSPTNYDNGGNGVGNYAVANPLDKGSDITASDGNLSISWGGVNGHSIRDSMAMSAGQWYCEYTMGSSSVSIGLIAQNISGISSGSGWPGSSTFGSAGSYGYTNAAEKRTNGSSVSYGATYTTGDVIGIAFDATAGTLTFYKNGSSQGTAFTGISGAYCFAIGYYGGSTGGTPAYANFGQRPFAYTPPTGYKALNTQNLSAPSIVNGAAYMAATLYTGNGATQSIINANNGVSFQPDFVWIKRRNAVQDHNVYDSVRGSSGGYVDQLLTNLTNAENSYGAGNYGAITTLNSNGFSVNSANSNFVLTNASGGTYVGWQWKAGGTAVTNTAGTITSSVSANTTAGFSVVTYTGTGATGTVGHGLGASPAMIIEKKRNVVSNWFVFFPALNYYFEGLNTTSAGSTPSTTQITVSSSTVSIVNAGDHSSSGSNYVWYCFAAIAGYSAFGSYTGNGSSSGPFIYTGFLPRFILIKSTSASRDWIIWDTARNPYNIGTAGVLFPDTSGAEYSGGGAYAVSVVSNGFYLPVSTANLNGSGETMIYAAFAESPFKYSLAR